MVNPIEDEKILKRKRTGGIVEIIVICMVIVFAENTFRVLIVFPLFLDAALLGKDMRKEA